MPQFEVEESEYHVPLLVEYTYTRVIPATYEHPEEGGLEEFSVFVQHPSDASKNIDITNFLSQESLDHWAQECEDHMEGEIEAAEERAAEDAEERRRERESEAA